MPARFSFCYVARMDIIFHRRLRLSARLHRRDAGVRSSGIRLR
ncbi:hypothetical protein GLE_0093 [Lysobacter enzymogenes]|uniref:Uncharacterized protein n=1 Tax=Lysobacter enzymogenes TaxID=69 RepID=A0A0S2DA85_LYSEN|nr:hypothetical protein GLE_0093 [Lysobacter enzymogenes]